MALTLRSRLSTLEFGVARPDVAAADAVKPFQRRTGRAEGLDGSAATPGTMNRSGGLRLLANANETGRRHTARRSRFIPVRVPQKTKQSVRVCYMRKTARPPKWSVLTPKMTEIASNEPTRRQVETPETVDAPDIRSSRPGQLREDFSTETAAWRHSSACYGAMTRTWKCREPTVDNRGAATR